MKALHSNVRRQAACLALLTCLLLGALHSGPVMARDGNRFPAGFEPGVRYVAELWQARLTGSDRGWATQKDAEDAMISVLETAYDQDPASGAALVAVAIATVPDLGPAVLTRMVGLHPELAWLSGAATPFPDEIARPARSALGVGQTARGWQYQDRAQSATQGSDSRIPPPRSYSPVGPGAGGIIVPSPTGDVGAPVEGEPVSDGEGPAEGDDRDPLEGMNRVFFFVNDIIDQAVLRPIAWTYSKITPQFFRDGVANFLTNLNSPVVLANDILQFEIVAAAETLGRFAINSTVGLGGVWDPAAQMGIPYHKSDFGQTLHSYGVGGGPYLVLPLLGPSNVRDTVGRVADTFLDPTSYLLNTRERLVLTGVQVLSRREQLLEPLDAVRADSVDYYVSIRSLYYQRRAEELRRGGEVDTEEQERVDRMFEEVE